MRDTSEDTCISKKSIQVNVNHGWLFRVILYFGIVLIVAELSRIIYILNQLVDLTLNHLPNP